MFALVAAGDMDAARELRLALDPAIHKALRRLTGDCAGSYMKPAK